MAEPKATTQKKHEEELVRKPDGTIELTVVIPWAIALKAKEEIEDALIKEVQIAGFRKGAAPKNIAKERLNPEHVKEEMLRKIIGKAYNDAVEKEKLLPIISPRIHIDVFEEGTDVMFTAETCEEPKIELGNYKDAIQKVTAKGKIAVPGKEEQKPTVDEILTAGISEAKVNVPDVLIESEISRLLSQMLDELKKIGLTLDQYLSSRNLNPEQLREEYKKKAEHDLKLEFFLRKVADTEKIVVEKEDIQKALNTIENPKEREEIMKNPYLVASIIRQQKTLDFLTKL